MSAVLDHGRLPWPAPEDLDSAQRALYESITGGPRSAGGSPFPLTDPDGRLHGPFNAMLQNPVVGAALQELGAAVRYRSGLTDRQREIAVLQVAAALRSDFEWYAHERAGRAAGLDEVELAALHGGTQPPGLKGAELAVHRATAQLLSAGDLDDAAFDALVGAVGTAGCTDLIVLVGYYRTLALALRALRVPLPDGAVPPFP